MVSVAMVVGAGIFKSPAWVAQNAGAAEWIFLAWLIGGAISLIGALCYAELATAFPNAGGDYHFIRLAFGKRVAFLFAWCRFTIINTGQIALLAFVLGAYAQRVWPMGPAGESLYAAAAIAALTLFNLRRTKAGAKADFALAGLEVAGVLLMCLAAGWMAVEGRTLALASSAPAPSPNMFAQALVFVMLAYGGWNETATFAAETRDKERGMARALVGSVIAITVLFMCANWALLAGLGVAGLASSEAPAADLMDAAFGPIAGPITALAIALAVLTSINATILTGGRVTYAWARDWPALNRFGRWDQERAAPAVAIWAQSAMALGLVVIGSFARDGFEAMVNFTSPIFWLFMAISGAALLVLRVREPNALRPFKAPLYPFGPIVFVAASVAMVWSSLVYVNVGALAALALLAVGAGVMAILERAHK